jgi:hypothetical protein
VATKHGKYIPFNPRLGVFFDSSNRVLRFGTTDLNKVNRISYSEMRFFQKNHEGIDYLTEKEALLYSIMLM